MSLTRLSRSLAAVVVVGITAGLAAGIPGVRAQSPDKYAIPATDEGLPGAGPIRRMEWFQNLWKQRRTMWAGLVDQDRGAVVFLGDSITQGWGGGLGAAFPGVKVANRGISGDTSDYDEAAGLAGIAAAGLIGDGG